MVDLSPTYTPLMLSGLTVHPENPLLIDFIVSTGDSHIQGDRIKRESSLLIKYFLACLTIPEDEQWVNLSPYEKERVVPAELGQTVLGRDMLAQDYFLKQLTASLIYPENDLGKDFWNKVYSQARERFGTTQAAVDTFNKVWILPDLAQVYTHHNTVFVVNSHFKVMLDEDYLALKKHATIGDFQRKSVNALGSQVVREIILPALEKEVNTGRNFATLRQIYNSMILSAWYKKNLKEALLDQVYVNKKKIDGVNVSDKAVKEKIYRQYLEAYKKGVFNYIKEDRDSLTLQPMPRKYFSGGINGISEAMVTEVPLQRALVALGKEGKNGFYKEPLRLAVIPAAKPMPASPAMTTFLPMAPATKDNKAILRNIKLLYANGYKRPVVNAVMRAVTGHMGKEETLFGIIKNTAKELGKEGDYGYAQTVIGAMWLKLAFNLNDKDFFDIRNNWSQSVLGLINLPVDSPAFFVSEEVERDAQLLGKLFKLSEKLGTTPGKNGNLDAIRAEIGLVNHLLLPLGLSSETQKLGELGPVGNLPEVKKKIRASIQELTEWRDKEISNAKGVMPGTSPDRIHQGIIRGLNSRISMIQAYAGLPTQVLRPGSVKPTVSFAMSAKNPAYNGGIDLNAEHLTMNSQGDKANFYFDNSMMALFKSGDFSGLQFKVLDVIPIDIRSVLGTALPAG